MTTLTKILVSKYVTQNKSSPEEALNTISALRSIDLTACNLSLDHLFDFSHYAQISVLVLNNNTLPDLSTLTSLPVLRTLSATNCFITHIGLGQAHCLENLDVRHNSIRSLTPADLPISLRTLKISDNPISDLSSLRIIQTLPLLERTDISIDVEVQKSVSRISSNAVSGQCFSDFDSDCRDVFNNLNSLFRSSISSATDKVVRMLDEDKEVFEDEL
ncbi:hypothetical protein RCL1_001087 [Eukaryota sp. TZLM3-RCL]